MSQITNKSCSMFKMFKYLIKLFKFWPKPENTIKLQPQQIPCTVESQNVRQGYLQLNDNCECTTKFFDTTEGMRCENISHTVTRNTVLILRKRLHWVWMSNSLALYYVVAATGQVRGVVDASGRANRMSRESVKVNLCIRLYSHSGSSSLPSSVFFTFSSILMQMKSFYVLFILWKTNYKAMMSSILS